jgi:geranylgeranyl diphosphate synthase, type I
VDPQSPLDALGAALGGDGNGARGPHDRDELLDRIRPIDRDVEEFLADVDRRLAPHLRRALGRVPDVHPLRRGMTHQIASGGKRIRAALCVASCELFGSPYFRSLDYAAAIEHMQNFTLVHDDIADGDDQRRAQESIWKQFGVPHGINIGDTFVPLAALAILRAPYPDPLKVRLLNVLAEFGLQMAVGQNLDINLRRNDAVTFDDYFECTTKKTGAFLAMATVGGGLIGGADEPQIQNLREFAMVAGVAFQIKDDILDIDGTKGRARGSDILEGKRTLMVVYATERASERDRRRLYKILNKNRPFNSPDEIAWVWDLYRATEAAEVAARKAEELVEHACEYLMPLPETEAKYRLLRLARYLSKRMH